MHGYPSFNSMWPTSVLVCCVSGTFVIVCDNVKVGILRKTKLLLGQAATKSLEILLALTSSCPRLVLFLCGLIG